MNKKSIILLLLPIIALMSGCNRENEENPTATNLSAYCYDKGVTLYWDDDKDASSYVIYNDTTEIREVDINYTVLRDLDNGTNYKLGVAAKKNGKVGEIKYINVTPDASGEIKDPLIDNLNTDLEKKIGSTSIKQMRAWGNVNTVANNPNANPNIYRFQRVLNAMKAGTSQTIGYIGGSITVGETATCLDSKNHQKGYAYYSYQWLKENFDYGRNSKFINASISGTDTCIASVRLEKDLLQYNPDLVFVEFCANNSTSQYDQKTYESLIRRILKQPNNPAVVLLFSATNYSQSHQNAYMLPMGNHYQLPMFSMVNPLANICGGSANLTTSNDIFGKFSDDGTHPNDQGHKLYAKLLTFTLKKLYELNDTYQSYSVPDSTWGSGFDAYENMTYVNNSINNSIVTSTGSFTPEDTMYRVLKDTADVEAFQKGWKKNSTTENNAMQITVTCKSFFIIYLAGNPSINGDPSGNMKATYTNSSIPSDTGTLAWAANKTQKQSTWSDINDNGNGWDNPCCIILVDKSSVATYNITIQMESSANKGVILAFGYCA